MERFPAYLHREEPDEDGAASINGSSAATTQALGHTQAKEVEEGDAHNAAHRGCLSDRQLHNLLICQVKCPCNKPACVHVKQKQVKWAHPGAL